MQYRLSTDNSKAGAISIQTDEELRLFKERLRSIIVPPRLANGKVSTRAPKAVLVYFEDVSDGNEARDTLTASSGSKKVIFYAENIMHFLTDYTVDYPGSCTSCIMPNYAIRSKCSNRTPGSEDAGY